MLVNHYPSPGDAEAAAGVVAELQAAGGTASAFPADVSKPEDCSALIEHVVAEAGRIDILVNNAGITRDGLLVRMSDEDWHAVIETDLTSVFACSRAAARPMMKQRARLDRERRLGGRRHGQRGTGQLLGGQGRRDRAHEDHRARAGGPRRALQRRRSRLHRDGHDTRAARGGPRRGALGHRDGRGSALPRTWPPPCCSSRRTTPHTSPVRSLAVDGGMTFA